ncbi:hypothetical protein H5407_14115 [Mitsuaria sp. WAJ17]|nr:hypothetical protein [Mitsuaria sp. WAJ17]
MFYVLGWLLVTSLIALWSLVAWALHAVAEWALSNAAALTGAAASARPLPDWLEPWVSTDLAQWLGSLLAEPGPFVEGLLQAAPALASGLTVAAWVLWGLGSAMLLLLGAGLHLCIARWHRRDLPA